MGFLLVPIWAELLQDADWKNINSLAVSEQAIWITNRLILFQFIGLQILAAIFLSSSISEEITRRTLGALWTTPIRGFEVVVGKLASKIAILIQMLAISLPFLMMLRMFGGIPWSLILGGCALTLATVFLVSSLSLFLSVYFKKPYVVIFLTAIILAIVFGLIPVMMSAFRGLGLVDCSVLENILWETNPYTNLIDFLQSFSQRGISFPAFGFVFQIGIGILLLIRASMSVRKRGLNSMAELPRREEFRPERYHPKAVFLFRPWFAHTLIKRWLGPGIIWKESVSPFFRTRHRMLLIILMAIGIGVVLWFLIIMTLFSLWALMDRGIQMVVVMFGFLTGVLLTLITAVTAITSEIEGQSWPILLTTPLSNARILGGKMYGVFRRSGWVWVALVLWGIISCYQGTLKGKMVIQWIPLFIVTTWFVLSMGFYLAVRIKRTLPSIAIGLIALSCLWVMPPFVTDFLGRILYSILQSGSLINGVLEWLLNSIRFDLFFLWCCEFLGCGNPYYLMTTTLDPNWRHEFPFYQQNHLIYYFLFTIVVYGFLGNLFCMKAGKLMRKRVFG